MTDTEETSEISSSAQLGLQGLLNANPLNTESSKILIDALLFFFFLWILSILIFQLNLSRRIIVRRIPIER